MKDTELITNDESYKKYIDKNYIQRLNYIINSYNKDVKYKFWHITNSSSCEQDNELSYILNGTLHHITITFNQDHMLLSIPLSLSNESSNNNIQYLKKYSINDIYNKSDAADKYQMRKYTKNDKLQFCYQNTFLKICSVLKRKNDIYKV
jgi:hypothetical protein